MAKIEEQELDVKKEEKGGQEGWIQELKQQVSMWRTQLPEEIIAEQQSAENPVSRFLQREIKKASLL